MTDAETLSTISFERVKAEAAALLAALPMPHNKQEQWRNTNIHQHYKLSAEAAATPDLHTDVPPFAGSRIFFRDGKKLETHDIESGIVAVRMSEATAEEKAVFFQYYNRTINPTDYFSVENTALAADVLLIRITKNQNTNEIIYLCNQTTDNTVFNFSRVLIIAEKNSEAKIWIDENAIKNAVCNHVIEIFVEENAVLHLHLHQQQKDAVTISTIHAQLAANARLHYSNWCVGNRFQRNNITAKITGSGANAVTNGLYINDGTELTDNHIFTAHNVPHTDSTQFFKGILHGSATGIFNGKIYVKQDAQKTNAFQNSKAILNSEEAFVFSKPELEIFADDVKCSHGVAIGQLNKKELFYFMARGIDKQTAQRILNFAFANDVLEKISFTPFKDYLSLKLKEIFSIDI